MAVRLGDAITRQILDSLEDHIFQPGRRFILRFQGQEHTIISQGLVDGAFRFKQPKEIVFKIIESGPDPGVELVAENEPDVVLMIIPIYFASPAHFTVPPLKIEIIDP